MKPDDQTGTNKLGLTVCRVEWLAAVMQHDSIRFQSIRLHADIVHVLDARQNISYAQQTANKANNF
jgi:hypothetical protein